MLFKIDVGPWAGGKTIAQLTEWVLVFASETHEGGIWEASAGRRLVAAIKDFQVGVMIIKIIGTYFSNNFCIPQRPPSGSQGKLASSNRQGAQCLQLRWLAWPSRPHMRISGSLLHQLLNLDLQHLDIQTTENCRDAHQ